jgi:hypothetical protein
MIFVQIISRLVLIVVPDVQAVKEIEFMVKFFILIVHNLVLLTF